MDRRYFIANWKSHFAMGDAEIYLNELKETIHTVDTEKNTLIICPSFTLLDYCSRKVSELSLPVKIGAQTVSSYEEGAYTGEVAARQIREFASFVIIGHSERRRYEHETDDDVKQKIEVAKRSDLQVIQCIQDSESFVSEMADIIAYEPPSAISTFGTGIPDDPARIEQVLSGIDQKINGKILIYGGSVNAETIGDYAHIPNCSGFLVGSASLDAKTFLSLPLAC